MLLPDDLAMQGAETAVDEQLSWGYRGAKLCNKILFL